MTPRLEQISGIKLVGKKLIMSFACNITKELWQSFMPNIGNISNVYNNDLYSIEIYPDLEFLQNFNPNKQFEKWAAIQVTEFTSIPEEMETLIIQNGLYAVFLYKGRASEAMETYQYIITNWIPNSEYQLDNRPHMAIMGEKYKHEHPDSEEELWIPVVKK
ncbi:GyrI-like domain-containing protein [Sunxiuqinia sp. A32]|uniref:GyrI-like domain-containing protein n=1 Tax=Sunxiuqinia sp. A32 TaxID=3461496 RepID=UPI0040460EE8